MMQSSSKSMSTSQRVIVRDFQKQFFQLVERYWNPNQSDEYWDSLTEDAMNLLTKFQTKDSSLNTFLSNLVATFLNSREEMM